jgi:hypothetical protein
VINSRLLLRAALWVRNPPSMGRIKLVFGIIAVAVVIIGIERLGFWPDWATSDHIPRRF